MAWLQVHQSLRNHRKILEAAHRLDVPQARMIGHMVILWLWAIDNSPHGDLSGLTPAVLAFAADWPGDAQAFVAALVEVGFLDQEGETLFIHDWADYTGRLIARREMRTVTQRERRQGSGRRTASANDWPAPANAVSPWR
jgi:hypothetical protein